MLAVIIRQTLLSSQVTATGAYNDTVIISKNLGPARSRAYWPYRQSTNLVKTLSAPPGDLVIRSVHPMKVVVTVSLCDRPPPP